MKTENLIKIQVVVGILATFATIFSFYKIKQTIEQSNQIKQEIRQLEITKAELERKKDDLQVKNADLATYIAPDRATPLQNPKGQVQSWLYIGRVSEHGKWSPISNNITIISGSPTNVDKIEKIFIKNNTLMADSISDNNIKPSSLDAVKPVFKFIKAGINLDIIKIQTSNSIGYGKLVWAQVNVNSSDILELK